MDFLNKMNSFLDTYAPLKKFDKHKLNFKIKPLEIHFY